MTNNLPTIADAEVFLRGPGVIRTLAVLDVLNALDTELRSTAYPRSYVDGYTDALKDVARHIASCRVLMSYKDVHVRVQEAHGRFCIEVMLGGVWNPIALREDREVARQLATKLRDVLSASVAPTLEDVWRDTKST